MKFLLDENAEARIGNYLKSQGHDVLRVGKDFPPSIPDTEVLEISVRESRILITNDSDFEKLIFSDNNNHSGVIYLHFPNNAHTMEKAAAVGHLLKTHSKQLDRFITLEPNKVTIIHLWSESFFSEE